jgi:hypothetical protein
MEKIINQRPKILTLETTEDTIWVQKGRYTMDNLTYLENYTGFNKKKPLNTYEILLDIVRVDATWIQACLFKLS